MITDVDDDDDKFQGNTIVERHIERVIVLVLGRFPADEHPAVRAFLTKVVFGRDWRWVASRVHVHPAHVRSLANRGRRLLDLAKEAGRFPPRDEAEAWLEEEMERDMQIASA